MTVAPKSATVIPAKAGIQAAGARKAAKWVPAFAGTNIG